MQMLKDLKISLDKAKSSGAITQSSPGANPSHTSIGRTISNGKYTQIAKNVVDKLYEHVSKCIIEDRSQVKMNMFEKAAISSGLKRMLPGTKEYLEGMNIKDINLLLGDILTCYSDDMIQAELKKRNIR